MNAVFRLNINRDIGTGHFFRCKTLAIKLKSQGYDIYFICNHEAETFVKGQNLHSEYSFYFLKSDSNEINELDEIISFIQKLKSPLILFLDSYSHTINWEKNIFPHVTLFIVLDDLGNKKHYSHFIIDPTYGRESTDYKSDYININALTGTKFAILPDEYRVERQKINPDKLSDFSQFNIHVFFGGVDSNNLTLTFSKYLLELSSNIKLHIVTGPLYLEIKSIQKLIIDFPSRIIHSHNTNKMWETFGTCNLAVGAPGITTWERAALGIPSIYLDIIENQKDILIQLQAAGLCEYLGSAKSMSQEIFYAKIKPIISNTEKLNSIRKNSLLAVDANGVNRIIEKITGALK
ncbi:MAG: UDP-2,4-diacetamido-2,4,6-trideoxy-beta-L-altropyranose hydrolase [Bacteriovorax sp.]|nr:UDP-2,4-diacetamido-2,4,6-trideoxy-beta-L-altropyranose hydrolase [Bacteriovorax sp.]